jgi:hypothetical protein
MFWTLLNRSCFSSVIPPFRTQKTCAMASVAVVVVAADRGHFNWSLPLAEALVTDDVVQKVESLGQRWRFWDAVPINGIQIYIYIYLFGYIITTSLPATSLEIMIYKGNHSQMALFQVSEIL